MSHDAIPTISFHREGDGALTIGPARASGVPSLVYGSQGLGAAPTSSSSSARLAGHGSTPRGSRLDERDIFLPLRLDTRSMSESNRVREDLLRFLSPLDKRGLTLRVHVPGRDRWREIPVKYSAGLEGDYDGSYRGNTEAIGLELRVHEALWRGEPESQPFQVDAPTKSFLSLTEPFFPVLLADSTVAGRITVNVAGDAPTAPLWTVTPPGEDLLIRHAESGSEFFLEGYLGETVNLDMSNGRLWSSSDPMGDSLWERVPATRGQMFSMHPGRNTIEFALVGSTADTMVHVTYAHRYLAGY